MTCAKKSYPSGAPIYATQEELDAALALWQKRLRLSDWEIAAELVGFEQMSEGTVGHAKRMSNKQSARIWMTRHEDYRTTPDHVETDCDMERVLVHELIHVHMLLFEPKEADSVEWALCERFVETMAHAFVDAYRKP